MTEKKKIGFALLSKERRKEISSRGGKNAQASPNVRRWTAEEARAQGQNAYQGSFTTETGKQARAKPGSSSFTSETGRQASEKKHDNRAKRDPDVVWIQGEYLDEQGNVSPYPFEQPDFQNPCHTPGCHGGDGAHTAECRAQQGEES